MRSAVNSVQSRRGGISAQCVDVGAKPGLVEHHPAYRVGNKHQRNDKRDIKDFKIRDIAQRGPHQPDHARLFGQIDDQVADSTTDDANRQCGHE